MDDPGIMQCRIDYWGKWWLQRDDVVLQITNKLPELRNKALDSWQDDPIDIESIDKAAATFAASTAVGIDAWSPRSIGQCSREAKADLSDVLNSIEAIGQWPLQTNLSLVGMIPKHEIDERPITALPTLYRSGG